MTGFPGVAGGLPVAHFAEIGSTNAEALTRAAAGAPEQWLVADRQVTGRGRRGRQWISEPGNLYASLLLYDPAPPALTPQICFVAALALHDAVCDCLPSLDPQRLRLKWPNDLLLDGRKLAGASGYADGVSLVHQGSLMIAPDLAAMAATLRMRSPEEQVTALSRLLGRDVHDAEVTTLLAQSIASALGRSLQRASLTSEEIARSEELFVRELGDENFVLHGDAARPPATMPGVAA